MAYRRAQGLNKKITFTKHKLVKYKHNIMFKLKFKIHLDIKVKFD